jgi:hypothetical protein
VRRCLATSKSKRSGCVGCMATGKRNRSDFAPKWASGSRFRAHSDTPLVGEASEKRNEAKRTHMTQIQGFSGSRFSLWRIFWIACSASSRSRFLIRPPSAYCHRARSSSGVRCSNSASMNRQSSSSHQSHSAEGRFTVSSLPLQESIQAW